MERGRDARMQEQMKTQLPKCPYCGKTGDIIRVTHKATTTERMIEGKNMSFRWDHPETLTGDEDESEICCDSCGKTIQYGELEDQGFDWE